MQLNKVVITDSTCFIILDKIDALPLLHNLFTVVLTTPEIANEYGKPLPDWVIIQPTKDNILQDKFNQYVDAGEASAIALAYEISSDFLILDDLEARKFAEKLGIQIKGTVGVILLAKQQGIISSVKPYLKEISKTNFRLSKSVIDKTLKDAGEF